MVSEICRYDVTGYSLIRNVHGKRVEKVHQEGEVILYSDKKLIGLIADSIEPVFNKLLLGVYMPGGNGFSEDDSPLGGLVAFLKLAPREYEEIAVMCSVTSEKLSNLEYPLGYYSGFWARLERFNLPELFKSVLAWKKVRFTPELIEFPIENFCDTFSQENLRKLEKNAMDCRSCGFKTRLKFVVKD